eukprot:gene17626-biopygen6814
MQLPIRFPTPSAQRLLAICVFDPGKPVATGDLTFWPPSKPHLLAVIVSQPEQLSPDGHCKPRQLAICVGDPEPASRGGVSRVVCRAPAALRGGGAEGHALRPRGARGSGCCAAPETRQSGAVGWPSKQFRGSGVRVSSTAPRFWARMPKRTRGRGLLSAGS